MSDKTAAVWIRASDDKSTVENQVPDLERFVARHGYEVTCRYQLDDDSAWKNGGSARYRATLQQALDDAWAGRFQVLIVWALDRIVREGAEEALRIIRQFRERGCTVVSIRESWLNSSPEVQDVLVAFAGWMAQQESVRRSERVKAGIARRKAEGLPVGRQPGVKDKRPRKRSGYVAAWEPGGARRPRAS